MNQVTSNHLIVRDAKIEDCKRIMEIYNMIWMEKLLGSHLQEQPAVINYKK